MSVPHLILLMTSYLIMIFLPLILAAVIHRRLGPSWRLFFIGLVTFVGSQILHIPFNWLVLNQLQLIPTDTSQLGNLLVLAAFAGLSAGVFEEGARYLSYRFWAKDARTWAQGLMMGAGHGGIESIIFGLLAAVNVGALALISMGFLADLLPAEQMILVEQQIEAVFGGPLYLTIFPALERVAAICLHLSLSLLVMQVFVRGSNRWLILAILWHALVNGVSLVALTLWGAVAAEGAIVIAAAISLAIIFRLRGENEGDETGEAPAAPREPADPKALDVTDEMLERSKYD